MSKNRINMIEGNIPKSLLKFAIPLMLSSILQLLFNAIDIIVVGNFAGDFAMAAVSSTTSLIHLIVNVFVGLSVGTNVVTANCIGSGNQEKIKKTVHTSIALSLIIGVIVTLIGLFFARPMLEIMGTPDDVMELAALYLKIYFSGTIFNMVYNFGASILRAHGDTQRPLYILTLAGVLNALLNVILVAIFDMSVAGVAIATIFSQFVSSLLVVIILIKEESSIKLEIAKIRVHFEEFKRIVAIGLPCGLQSIAFSLSNVIIQSSINTFGSYAMAANGAASNIEGFLNAVEAAVGQSAQVFVSQNYGAKNFDRIKKVIKTAAVYSISFCVLGGMLVRVFGTTLLGIYTDSMETINYGMIRISYVALVYFTFGLMDLMSGVLRAVGKSTRAFVCTVTGVCAFRILWILTAFRKFPSLNTIYMSYPISWTLTLCFLTLMVLRTLKTVKADCLGGNN